jgi:peptidyl-prolyl cis-trans isomerase D
MLQKLREKKSGLFVKIVLGIIVIGFSFFGIESYFVAGTDNAVAKVGKTKITQDEFRQRFNQYRQRMMRIMGDAANGEFFQKPEVKHQLLDRMVDENVLIDANQKLGIAIPAERLRDEIAGTADFQTDGKFDPERYRTLLASNGLTARGYEQTVRRDLEVRALPGAVSATSVVSRAEVDNYLRLKDQKRDLHYVTLDKPAPSTEPVADADIDAWYKAHPDQFMTPERVAISYLELDAGKLSVDAQPPDSALKELYDKEKSRFVSSEQRLASHILVDVPGKGTPDDQKAALAKAEDIEKQLHDGADFATLARKYSDDLGSRNQGGDLGWLDKGTTDQAFEDALFAMSKGSISDPVLSPEGYHIIDLRDVRPGKTRSFEEVKPDLAREYTESQRETEYGDKAGKLTDLTYQDPSSLDPAAKALGLTVQTLPLFSRTGGPGIAANPDVVKAAFSDNVMVQGNNSDPIDLGSDHIVVIHVTDHKPAVRKALADVKDVIRTRIIAERTSKAAKDRADALFAKLGGAADLGTIAAGEKLEVKQEQGIGRDAANLDSAVVKAVFAMSRPAPGKPSRKLVPLANDSYALVQLDRVIDGDPAKVDAKTREAARNTLARGEGVSATFDFVAALRKDVKVEINDANM